MANYTYEQLMQMSDDDLLGLGFIRNERGGLSRIRAGIAETEIPPDQAKREPERIDFHKVQPLREVPCGGCAGEKKVEEGVAKQTMEQLQELAKNGRQLIAGEKTLGLLNYIRAKTGGKVNGHTQSTRMSVCKTCEVKSKTGKRLYREVHGVPYCGTPKKEKVIRNEQKEGCGCDLRDKVRWVKAKCPHDKWGEGSIIGSSAHVVVQKKEQRKLPGVIDVRSRTKDATDYTGIGDVLAALPIVHAIAIAREERVRYRVVPNRIAWAQLGWPDVSPDTEVTDIGEEVMDINTLGANDFDVELEKDGRNRHEFWFATAGVRHYKPKLEVDQEGKAWATEQFREARKKKQKIVVVAPFANAPSRQYPLHHWIQLVELLQKEDVHVVMVDSDPHRGRYISCQRYWGWKPTHISALVASADLFIGNDSGMTHLAGVFDVPALALCSVTWGKTVFGWYDSIKVIQTETKCTGCLWRLEKGHQRACLSICHAMWELSAQTVFENAMNKLAEKPVPTAV